MKAGDLQAFGRSAGGNCFVDSWPGTAVLSTCSSKSSAEATFEDDILKGLLARECLRLIRVDTRVLLQLAERIQSVHADASMSEASLLDDDHSERSM